MIRLPTLTVALALGLLFPTSRAVPEFVNHGKTSGWLDVPPEAKGTKAEVTNVVYRGSSGLKVTQTYIPDYTGRYHSEFTYPNGYKRGDTKFYGFAFRLADAWEFDPPQTFNIAQWIADFGDTGCDDYSPTSMVYLRGRTLYSRVKTGQLLPGKKCPPDNNKGDCSGGKNCQNTREFALATNIDGGVWYRLTFQITWAADATGQFKTWINGTKVHEEYEIPTTLLDDKRVFSFRVGLYANGWHDDKEMYGSQSFRQVWIDEVGIGSEFKDADPDRL